MQVLAHNLLSQFTNRQLNITSKGKEKSAEKLSSGYQINRSADDAAGLQISEKMRWQIRGLMRGEENIGDGISLIQTADGAMSEIHSVLQRVRELSIQAYNDTNTQSDRDAIQAEINESLKEIDRIATTTTFNTKQILLGNATSTVQITGDEEIGTQVRETRVTSAPSWLYVDSEMTVHGYTQTGQSQSNMLTTVSATDNTPANYYGQKDYALEALGYSYGGSWTDSISDNASAKIDFSGLITNSNTALDLYNNLFSLIGTKISFGCGTCSSYINSLSFGGSEKAMTTESFEKAEGAATDVEGNVNLSSEGYFKQIQALLDTYGENYETGTHIDATGNETADVQALAMEIAKDLREKVYEVLDNKTGNHFDRVIRDSTDDYSLYIYDYRDTSKLTNVQGTDPDGTIADTSVRTTAKVTYLKDITMTIPGEKATVVSPLMIECGALAPNAIAVDLPNVSLAALGITGYSINKYNTMETYSDSYKQSLQDYYNSKTITQQTGTRTESYIVTPATAPIYSSYTSYVNGEPKTKTILLQSGSAAVYGTRQVSYTYTTTSYRLPYPTANAGDITISSVYDPDSVELIDDAIAKVSRARSRMGALQNRLEHAYSINANSAENTQAAESQIRDTDMAEEMISYSRHNILEQAGQSMLAQANQSTQGILSLLQ